MHEFDEFAKNYSGQIESSVKFSGKEHSFFINAKAKKITSMLKSLSRGQIKVLDIGCGVGALHSFLTDPNLILYGVDVSNESIKVAQKDHPQNIFSHYDGKRLPYDDNYFDAAFTVCVMHHIQLQKRNFFMEEMCRVVKSSGLIIIAEHNMMNPLTQYVVKTSPIDKNAILLSNKETTELFLERGIKDVQSEYILLTPFESKWAQWLENCLKNIPLGAQYVTWGHTE